MAGNSNKFIHFARKQAVQCHARLETSNLGSFFSKPKQPPLLEHPTASPIPCPVPPSLAQSLERCFLGHPSSYKEEEPRQARAGAQVIINAFSFRRWPLRACASLINARARGGRAIKRPDEQIAAARREGQEF